jgi:hypothetical protein
MTLRVIDILGVALILGLMLRYGQEATQLIAASSNAVAGVYGTAALYSAPAPPLRGG